MDRAAPHSRPARSLPVWWTIRRTTSQLRDMLVDFAPYLFRGRVAGFLTRLSASGLANVTSGGGQVPSFVVEDRR